MISWNTDVKRYRCSGKETLNKPLNVFDSTNESGSVNSQVNSVLGPVQQVKLRSKVCVLMLMLGAERSCFCFLGNNNGQKCSHASNHPLIKAHCFRQRLSRSRKDENGTQIIL